MHVCDWVGVHLCQKNVQSSEAEDKNIKMKYIFRTIFIFALPTGLERREAAPAGRGEDSYWNAVRENNPLPPGQMAMSTICITATVAEIYMTYLSMRGVESSAV
jgi:hypothetical protein